MQSEMEEEIAASADIYIGDRFNTFLCIKAISK